MKHLKFCRICEPMLIKIFEGLTIFETKEVELWMDSDGIIHLEAPNLENLLR